MEIMFYLQKYINIQEMSKKRETKGLSPGTVESCTLTEKLQPVQHAAL